MNAILAARPVAAARLPQSVAAVVIPLSRHLHRERDFGVGYGNSSGYAAVRRYASNWAPPRFKFA